MRVDVSQTSIGKTVVDTTSGSGLTGYAIRAVERLENQERANAIKRQMLDAASRRPRDRDDLLERLREGGP